MTNLPIHLGDHPLRRLSKRLANRGTGTEYIRIIPQSYTRDEDFNAVLNNNAAPGDTTNAPLGMSIRAVVSRSKGTVVPAAGSGTGSPEAVFMYSLTLYSDSDPQIAEGQQLVWESRTVAVDGDGVASTPQMAVLMSRDLVAASNAIARGPGMWVVGAQEMGGMG